MRILTRILTILLATLVLSACSPTLAETKSVNFSVPPVGEPVSGIAFISVRDGNTEIYLIQPDGTGLTRLTDDPDINADPTWSSECRQIAFRSRRDATTDIFIMNADGSYPTNMIRDPEVSLFNEFYPSWSPDGQTLALITDHFELGGCSWHIVALMPFTGGIENIRHIDTVTGNQRSVAWSPDGQSLTFSNSCGPNDAVSLFLWSQDTAEVLRLTHHKSQNIYPA